jgi:hypothetical protein
VQVSSAYNGTQFIAGFQTITFTGDVGIQTSDVIFTTETCDVPPTGAQGPQGYQGFQGIQGSASKFTADIGNGADTGIQVTHGLGTEDVLAQLRYTTAPMEYVTADMEIVDLNNILFTFDSPPGTAAVRAIIIG